MPSDASGIKFLVGRMKNIDFCSFPIEFEGFGRKPAPYYRLASLQHIALFPRFLINLYHHFQTGLHSFDCGDKLRGGTIPLKNLDEKIMIGGVIGLYKVNKGHNGKSWFLWSFNQVFNMNRSS